MKIPFSFLLLILMVPKSDGQVYHSFHDFIANLPDTNYQVRKVTDVRVDTLAERCWFANGKKGMIKDAFALTYQDRLYLQEKSIRQNLPATFHPYTDKESNSYFPVLEKGRYLYLEILSDDKAPDLSIAMGLMGGAVGNALGTAITPPEWHKSAVIFDSTHQLFYAFDTWKEAQDFLKKYHPNFSFTSPPSGSDLERIRWLFRALNQQ